MMVNTLILAADHGGFELKEFLRGAAEQEVIDVGAYSQLPEDDYPEFAHRAAKELQERLGEVISDPDVMAVLCCRTGVGMAIVANRYPGVRAAVCRTQEDTRLAREKNNCNALVLEADHVSFDEAWQLVQTFLSTPFAGERHARRVRAIEEVI